MVYCIFLYCMYFHRTCVRTYIRVEDEWNRGGCILVKRKRRKDRERGGEESPKSPCRMCYIVVYVLGMEYETVEQQAACSHAHADMARK